MSRLRYAALSLSSGYAAMASNVAYSLASIPLALHYLGKEEFGLWAVVTQVASYLLLLDFGVSGSVSRILIDHKDNKESGRYGSVIKTGCLVLLVQGVCVALGGTILSIWLPSLVDVPARFASILRTLAAGQCILYGTFFAGRILTGMLQAHQRFDMMNYTAICQFIANFATQWVTFHRGWGLYSMLAASFAGLACGVVCNLLQVLRLRLLPPAGHDGKASVAIFKEVFSFGSELFVLTIGLQLLNASQVVIITKTLGLTAATAWTVATKTFVLGQQFVGRIFDFSGSALGEMVVRGERQNLQRRFRDILVLTASLAVFAGAAIAVCNGSFIVVWTKRAYDWPWWNDALMGILLTATCVTRCHIGLSGYTKEIGALRYVYFLEGATFVVGAYFAAGRFGMAGIIAVAILANMAWTGSYGIIRTARYFGAPPGRLVAEWFTPALKFLALFWPLTAALWWAAFHLAPLPRLTLEAAVLILAGPGLLWRIGLTPELRHEFKERIVRKLRR